ncbi:hypothetical protein [Thioalkalivibrio thiocyanodenitrificans]|uniref:hypothetical protein n=1 Tax=Thioalkalivibrio thiocyanodenitrificans TaxID=243063 RepID=UPI00037B6F17|nr:hypothetical protein [Thioalkalivibrio thiocyanodenitrificans]
MRAFAYLVLFAVTAALGYAAVVEAHAWASGAISLTTAGATKAAIAGLTGLAAWGVGACCWVSLKGMWDEVKDDAEACLGEDEGVDLQEMEISEEIVLESSKEEIDEFENEVFDLRFKEEEEVDFQGLEKELKKEARRLVKSQDRDAYGDF